uniref:Uncharacterized protein n=1 Tax=Arundo donax TaxID=35708 RepID=A0A0A9AGK7_ARUDO
MVCRHMFSSAKACGFNYMVLILEKAGL